MRNRTVSFSAGSSMLPCTASTGGRQAVIRPGVVDVDLVGRILDPVLLLVARAAAKNNLSAA